MNMYPRWMLIVFGVMLSVCGVVIGGAAGAFVVGLTVGIVGAMVYFHKEISDASK